MAFWWCCCGVSVIVVTPVLATSTTPSSALLADIQGNAAVDELAKIAANRYAPTDNEVEEVHYRYRRAQQIMVYAAKVLADWERQARCLSRCPIGPAHSSVPSAIDQASATRAIPQIKTP